MSGLKDRATKIAERPGIAHLLRANKRFGERLGNQFGAAITYFSVLAVVPIIMLAFSVLGFVLVTAAPHLLDDTLDRVNSALSGFDPSTRKSIGDMIENALRHYKSIGIIGAVSALYAGAGWIGNLKDAVRAQWRPSFDLQIKPENFIKRLISNILILIGLLILVAVTFGLASVSTSLSDNIIGWLGLDDVGWLGPVLRLVPILISIGAGWLVFMFLCLVLPETREPGTAVRRGSLIGAIGLGVLEYLTSFLFGAFAGNPAAALFGPVIVLMLFLNLFARLTLFVAAWIGTAVHAAEPDFVTEAEGVQQSERAGQVEQSGQVEQPDSGDPSRTAPVPVPVVPDGSADPRGRWSSTPGLIPEATAARSVRAGTGVGYLVGAVTGIGAGSAFARLLMRRRLRNS